MERKDWKKLDDCIRGKLNERRVDTCENNEDVDEKLRCKQAIDECVPDKKRLCTIKREISDSTRRLYEERARKFSSISAQGGKVTRQLRKR